MTTLSFFCAYIYDISMPSYVGRSMIGVGTIC